MVEPMRAGLSTPVGFFQGLQAQPQPLAEPHQASEVWSDSARGQGSRTRDMLSSRPGGR